MTQAAPDGQMAACGGGDDFRHPTAAPDGLLPTWGNRTLLADAISAALTALLSGNITLAAKLIFSAAASQLVPGATSFSIRNHADSADNLLVSDAGVVTARAGVTITTGNLAFSGTSQKVVAPTTSLLIRDHGDANTNVTILDNGNLTARGDLAGVNGTFSGTVTAAGVTAVSPVAAITADGAITITAQSKTYFITKAGVAAETIVDPTATTHDGVTLTFISATANAHTLDNSAGSGFFSSGGASKDVATFGGAIGDGFTIIAYQGKWYVRPGGTTNVTLG